MSASTDRAASPSGAPVDAPNGGRVAALDGLRAAAVLAVLADHFWPGGSVGARVPLGMLGVKLFFVMSGYLISGILLRAAGRVDRGETTRGAALRAFWARRFLRIFPAYYLVLGTAYALDLGEVRSSVAWHAAYLSNFRVALVDRGWPPFTGHFWSLALEEQFYVVWPFALLVVAAGRRTFAVVAALVLAILARIAAVAAGLDSHALAVLPVGSLDALLLGALLAALEADGSTGAAWRRRIDAAALWIGLPLLGALAWLQRNGAAEDLRRVLWPLALALVFFRLVGAVADPASVRLRRVLAWPPLVRLGVISYGVYLYHPFVAHGVTAALGLPKITNVGVSLLCAAVSVALAEVSWRLFEAPLVRLKERFNS